MKTIQTLLLIFTFALMTTSYTACKKCENEDPRARIVNNGTDKASVQIKTSGGNTVNINNVDPSTASPYVGYAAGETTFTISVNEVPYEITVMMQDCFEYDISIDENNIVTSLPIDRNE